MAVVQQVRSAALNPDSSDEEKEEDEPEDEGVSDSEILEDLPDDTEVGVPGIALRQCHFAREP